MLIALTGVRPARKKIRPITQPTMVRDDGSKLLRIDSRCRDGCGRVLRLWLKLEDLVWASLASSRWQALQSDQKSDGIWREG
jgi:hypothetical protein